MEAILKQLDTLTEVELALVIERSNEKLEDLRYQRGIQEALARIATENLFIAYPGEKNLEGRIVNTYPVASTPFTHTFDARAYAHGKDELSDLSDPEWTEGKIKEPIGSFIVYTLPEIDEKSMPPNHLILDCKPGDWDDPYRIVHLVNLVAQHLLFPGLGILVVNRKEHFEGSEFEGEITLTEFIFCYYYHLKQGEKDYYYQMTKGTVTSNGSITVVQKRELFEGRDKASFYPILGETHPTYDYKGNNRKDMIQASQGIYYWDGIARTEISPDFIYLPFLNQDLRI